MCPVQQGVNERRAQALEVIWLSFLDLSGNVSHAHEVAQVSMVSFGISAALFYKMLQINTNQAWERILQDPAAGSCTNFFNACQKLCHGQVSAGDLKDVAHRGAICLVSNKFKSIQIIKS